MVVVHQLASATLRGKYQASIELLNGRFEFDVYIVVEAPCGFFYLIPIPRVCSHVQHALRGKPHSWP
jgi:hypothetical protein